jgi:hypothetical protein
MFISLSRADLRCAISLLGLVASVERKKRQITVVSIKHPRYTQQVLCISHTKRANYNFHFVQFLVLTILSQVIDLAWVGVHGQYAQEYGFAQLDHAPAFVANIVRSHIFALALSFFQIVFTVITVVFTLLILCSKKYGNESQSTLAKNDGNAQSESSI